MTAPCPFWVISSPSGSLRSFSLALKAGSSPAPARPGTGVRRRAPRQHRGGRAGREEKPFLPPRALGSPHLQTHPGSQSHLTAWLQAELPVEPRGAATLPRGEKAQPCPEFSILKKKQTQNFFSRNVDLKPVVFQSEHKQLCPEAVSFQYIW